MTCMFTVAKYVHFYDHITVWDGSTDFKLEGQDPAKYIGPIKYKQVKWNQSKTIAANCNR